MGFVERVANGKLKFVETGLHKDAPAVQAPQSRAGL